MPGLPVAVAAGAFGAHGAATPQAAEWLRTGAGYQLAHAVAALAAIALGVEALLVSSFLWLPVLFDALERTAGAMMVAVRQLRARKSGFLTAISFLAFLGVGLSSFGLCLTISVMSGFGSPAL